MREVITVTALVVLVATFFYFTQANDRIEKLENSLLHVQDNTMRLRDKIWKHHPEERNVTWIGNNIKCTGKWGSDNFKCVDIREGKNK